MIRYLQSVLEIVLKKKDQVACSPQKLLLCTWIIELKLNEINDIVSKKESEKMSLKDKEKFEEIYQRKMQSFRDFLKNNKDHVNEETVF